MKIYGFFNFRNEFAKYSEHIISAWFLRSTKIEAMSAKTQLQHCAIVTSDFGENILVVRKHETSDQFFHRMQV